MLLVKVLKVNILLVSKLLHCLDHGHQVTIVFVKGAKLLYCWLRSPSCCPCTVGQCRQVVIMLVRVYKSVSCCSMSPSGFAVGQGLKVTILLVSKLRYCEALYFLQIDVSVQALVDHIARSKICSMFLQQVFASLWSLIGDGPLQL